MRFGRAVLTGLLALCPAFAASAQEQHFGPFVFDPARPGVGLLSGAMERGTFAGFVDLLAAEPRLHTLVLDSPGGLDVDSRRIADLVDALGIDTVVPDNAICFSACATIYFAGKNRIALGRLGVHRSSSEEEFLDRGELHDLIAVRIESWFHYGVPPEVLIVTYRTPAEDIYVFSEQELEEWELNRGSVAAMRGIDDTYLLALADQRSANLYKDAFGREEEESFDGRVTWRLAAGDTDLPVVEATVDIPAGGMQAVIRFRDDPVEGSQFIDITFDTGTDPVATLDNVIVNSGGANALAFFGRFHAPGENTFTFELSERWEERNLPLLLEREELTFLITYESGREATLTLDRTATADAVFAEAAAAWDTIAPDRDPDDRAILVMPDETGTLVEHVGRIIWTIDEPFVQAAALFLFDDLDLAGRLTLERNSSRDVGHTARITWSAPRPTWSGDRLGTAGSFGFRVDAEAPFGIFEGEPLTEGITYRFQIAPDAGTEGLLESARWLEWRIDYPGGQGWLALEVGTNGADIIHEITDRWVD
ncbi:MAG: hypothetical protein AB7O56_08215 [Bauldia sp.]